ncbi:hypothetical protein NFI96_007133, partial [Prochilodus magdalenae]
MHRDDGNHRSYTDHQSSCSKSCTPSDLTNLTLGSVSRGNPLETRRRSYNSEISFHRFPVDPEVRARWLTQIRRDDFSPLQSPRVRSRHFNKLQKLNKGAVPCLFAWNDYSMPAPRLNVWQRRPRCPSPVLAASDTDQEMEVQIVPDHDYSVTPTTSAMADALANESEALKRKRQELQHQLEASQLQSRFGLQPLAGSDEDSRFYT